MNAGKKLLIPLLGVVLATPGLLNANSPPTVTQIVQTPLFGKDIPQFVDPLPSLHTVVAGTDQIELDMTELKTKVMPTGFIPANGLPYTGTWVWSYLEDGQVIDADTSFIGPVIVATRGTPTEIKFENDLGNAATSKVLAYTQSTDQTLQWADPLNDEANACAHQSGAPSAECAQHFAGAIPAVPHLHGGEVPPQIDGGPDAWFTSDGENVGHAYYSMDGEEAKNYGVYRYPNSQEAAPLWFHEHTLGATRLNVYAGLAGAYLLVDSALNLPANLQEPADIVPLVIQDRMFDTNGQLFFPNSGINPEHPYWVPEFLGNTIVVNGKVWPYKDVEQKRYRFLFLNGSNARPYELFLTDPVTKMAGPPMWVIGTDGGYLDAPVKIDTALGQKLVIMPGERYDVIIDFADSTNNPSPSGTYILRNTGRAPYPNGTPPDGATVGRVLQFRVGSAPASEDPSYDPAEGTPLRTGDQTIKRLVNPAGTLANDVTPLVTRQLTLNEFMGPGGPLQVLLNNTALDGRQIDSVSGLRVPLPGATSDGLGDFLTELPAEGSTEVWEIVNLTADAHPIHLHLVQYQVMNRQRFNVSKYMKAYDALFPASVQLNPLTGLPYPGGVYIGAYGPPLPYNTPNSAGAVGGNPAITPYLQGKAYPVAPHEAGWKDTVIAYPGEVTRIVVHWGPTSSPIGGTNLQFPFNPDGGHGYVWHCHIIDHEDNEMMRSDSVQPLPGATRTYIKGTDY